MSTTIRIRPADKAVLDRLQAQYLLRTGQRASLEDILHRALRVAAARPDEIASETDPRLSAAQKRKVLSLPYDFGRATTSQTIDEELYGDRGT